MLGNINPIRTRRYVPLNRNNPYVRLSKASTDKIPMPHPKHPALRPKRPQPPQWLLDTWQIKI